MWFASECLVQRSGASCTIPFSSMSNSACCWGEYTFGMRKDPPNLGCFPLFSGRIAGMQLSPPAHATGGIAQA